MPRLSGSGADAATGRQEKIPITFKRSMPPVGSTDATLIILGSLPGEVSLREQRYYAHPQNQFWRLLGLAIGEELAALGYGQRLARLSKRGIALWDVVGEARRKGSLDGDIRDASANKLIEFVETHPRLKAVAFNGKTAARIGRPALSGILGVELLELPSSSPAFTLGFARKAESWAALGVFARLPEDGKVGL